LILAAVRTFFICFFVDFCAGLTMCHTRN